MGFWKKLFGNKAVETRITPAPKKENSPTRTKARKVGGSIGYFGLSEWWLDKLTEEDRQYILDKFQPMGERSSGLIKGRVSYQSKSTIWMLTTLAGWFRRVDEAPLARKIIAEAEELIGPFTAADDVHFVYQEKIGINYREREQPGRLDEAIEACNQLIEIAPKAARAFRFDFPSGGLPTHGGYKQLCIIHEKRRDFAEAIALAKQAKSQGWQGDWDKRIQRCESKLAKSQ